MKRWYQKRCCLTKTTNKKRPGSPKRGARPPCLRSGRKKSANAIRTILIVEGRLRRIPQLGCPRRPAIRAIPVVIGRSAPLREEGKHAERICDHHHHQLLHRTILRLRTDTPSIQPLPNHTKKKMDTAFTKIHQEENDYKTKNSLIFSTQ